MVFFIYIQILKKLLFANSGEPDQTPRFAASDLVLHCLPLSHKKDARLKWVKPNVISHSSQLDLYISVLRIVMWYFKFVFLF